MLMGLYLDIDLISLILFYEVIVEIMKENKCVNWGEGLRRHRYTEYGD